MVTGICGKFSTDGNHWSRPDSTVGCRYGTSPWLGKYRDQVLGLVATDELSESSARDRLQVVKQVLQFAWKLEYIANKPRILDEGYTAVQIPDTTIEVYNREEITKILDAAPDVMLLYILLMLNCGFQPVDIASLKQQAVDWTNGNITRKRTKTKRHKKAPVVTYTLWPMTFVLLRSHRSGDNELALTNRKGNPLQQVELREGKVVKTCNISTRWARLKKKCNAARSIKALRSTAATVLASHPTYGRYAQLFLGHSPRTVADKHYIVPDQEQFDAALAWLRDELIGSTSCR